MFIDFKWKIRLLLNYRIKCRKIYFKCSRSLKLSCFKGLAPLLIQLRQVDLSDVTFFYLVTSMFLSLSGRLLGCLYRAFAALQLFVQNLLVRHRRVVLIQESLIHAFMHSCSTYHNAMIQLRINCLSNKVNWKS